MALAGPRGEQQQDSGALVAAQRVSLVGLEAEEHSRTRFVLVATRGDADGAFQHRHPRVLLDLVIPERLAGLEHDQDGSRSVVRMENGRVSCSSGRLDLQQVPRLHAGQIPTPR